MKLSLFPSFRCSCPKAEAHEEPCVCGGGEETHAEVRGHGQPHHLLQVVQRWHRAQEEQRDQDQVWQVSEHHVTS